MEGTLGSGPCGLDRPWALRPGISHPSLPSERLHPPGSICRNLIPSGSGAWCVVAAGGLLGGGGWAYRGAVWAEGHHWRVDGVWHHGGDEIAHGQHVS